MISKSLFWNLLFCFFGVLMFLSSVSTLGSRISAAPFLSISIYFSRGMNLMSDQRLALFWKKYTFWLKKEPYAAKNYFSPEKVNFPGARLLFLPNVPGGPAIADHGKPHSRYLIQKSNKWMKERAKFGTRLLSSELQSLVRAPPNTTMRRFDYWLNLGFGVWISCFQNQF